MVPSDTFCGQCDRPIFDEASDDRRPCPECSSLKRRYELSGHAKMRATATAELTVITYPQTLLATGRDLLKREQYGIAIVVAHMACEVAAERSLAEAFKAKSLTHLEDPILAFVNGFNLATPRIRELYSALTGDEIQKQPFWPPFTTSAKLRNSIMHNGKIASLSDAESSISAATALVAHLNK